MPNPVESPVHAFWWGKQTALGSVLDETATSLQRLRFAAGDMNYARDDGSEPFSDLTVYGSQQDFINSASGEGEPAFQAQPEKVDKLIHAFMGVTPTTVGAADPFVHTFQPPTPPAAQSNIYGTLFKRVGSSEIDRKKFGDCIIMQLVLEGSTANKVVRITPRLLSLDPAIVFDAASEPTTALDGTDAFVYTEGAARFKLALAQDLANTVAVRGHSQFQITINRGLAPQYGDDVTPYAFFQGRPEVTIRCTVPVDDVTRAQINRLIYGNPAPAADAKPLKTIPPIGSYEIDLQRPGTVGGAMTTAGSKGLRFEMAGVKWEPGIPIPADPNGGVIEAAFAGSLRRRGSTTPYKFVVTNGVNNAAVIASG